MLNTKSGRKGPHADDSVKGVIQFRAGGSAFVVVDGKRDEPSIQIAPDDTGVALPGDRTDALRAASPPVLARVVDGQTVCDLRTVFPEQDSLLAKALAG